MKIENQSDLLQPVVYCTEDNNFYCNGELICTCSYDKRQQKYITKHIHNSYKKGYKFLYANSPIGLASQIQKIISKK